MEKFLGERDFLSFLLVVDSNENIMKESKTKFSSLVSLQSTPQFSRDFPYFGLEVTEEFYVLPDGKKHGKYIMKTREKGTLVIEKTFDTDSPIGKAVCWQNLSNKKRYEIDYDKREREDYYPSSFSRSIFDENDKVTEKEFYMAGYDHPIERTLWINDPQITRNYPDLFFKEMWYHTTKAKMCSFSTYSSEEHGRVLTGKVKSWYQNGQIAEEAQYSNGTQVCYKSWHPDGAEREGTTLVDFVPLNLTRMTWHTYVL